MAKKKMHTPTRSEIFWNKFKNFCIDNGYTNKIVGDLSFTNKKGKQMKLISTTCGIITVYDETKNRRYTI